MSISIVVSILTIVSLVLILKKIRKEKESEERVEKEYLIITIIIILILSILRMFFISEPVTVQSYIEKLLSGEYSESDAMTESTELKLSNYKFSEAYVENKYSEKLYTRVLDGLFESIVSVEIQEKGSGKYDLVIKYNEYEDIETLEKDEEKLNELEKEYLEGNLNGMDLEKELEEYMLWSYEKNFKYKEEEKSQTLKLELSEEEEGKTGKIEGVSEFISEMYKAVYGDNLSKYEELVVSTVELYYRRD